MKILQFSNQTLASLVTETAILKASVAAGSAKDITLNDNNGFADDDLVLIGEIGSAKSEIFQINTTVTAGTIIQADTLVYPHGIGTPVYKIPFDQVKFYRAATIDGEKTLLDTVDIDADNQYTTYVDVTNTTGYLFFVLYNSVTTDASDYSAGFDYGTISYGSRIKIREFVTSPHNWSRPLDEATFETLCDSAEAEIFAIKRWRFREATSTFNTVASQQAYTLAVAGCEDLGQLIYATYDGDPVIPADIKTHQNINWNVVTSGTPNRIWEWNGSLYLTPIPSEIKAVVLYYYKNSSGFANETSESEVQLPMAIAFRILQDLWATVDPNKAQYFERRYLQTVQAMKMNDVKQVSKFPTLADSRVDKFNVNSQIDNPIIT